METKFLEGLMSIGSGGIVASIIFYFYREKATRLSQAEAQILALQQQVVDILKAQIDAEPQRREVLGKVVQSLADMNTFIKERLK